MISFFCLSLFTFSSFNIQPTKADFNNLKLCKDSPAFQKRLNSSVKKLENRLKYIHLIVKKLVLLQKKLNKQKQGSNVMGTLIYFVVKKDYPELLQQANLTVQMNL